MSRVVVTTAYFLPSGEYVPKNSTLEETAAQAAARVTAGGAIRVLSATAGTGGAGDRCTLGESVAASNATP